jgi:tRNA 2-thiouridine synthesizing protein A
MRRLRAKKWRATGLIIPGLPPTAGRRGIAGARREGAWPASTPQFHRDRRRTWRHRATGGGFLTRTTAWGSVAPVDPALTLVNPDKRIDCIGLFCPLPVVKTREALRAMGIGQVLEVLADDPAAEADMRTWAARAGHQLVELSRLGSVYRFLVRKAR